MATLSISLRHFARLTPLCAGDPLPQQVLNYSGAIQALERCLYTCINNWHTLFPDGKQRPKIYMRKLMAGTTEQWTLERHEILSPSAAADHTKFT